MKNVDKLTDTLIHIEHVLEKNIPKGYHEIVQEYVNQNMVAIGFYFIDLVALALLAFFIIKWCKRYTEDIKYDEENKFWVRFVTIIVVFFLIIAGFSLLSCMLNAAQRAVSPTWYILQKLLSK